MKRFSKLWVASSIARSSQTTIYCFIGGLLANILYHTDVNIIFILLIAAIAGACSSLISLIFGLPEASTDGTLLVDTNNPVKDIYRLSLDCDLSLLPKKKTILLSVDPKADLSQK